MKKITKPGPATHTKLSVVPKRPPKVNKTKADYLEAGLLLLEVTAEQVDNVAKIEHLFSGIGGKEKVLEYLGGSEEPEAREVLNLRNRLTQLQAKAVPFEAYCVAADISTKRMFGIISQEVVEQSAKATELLKKASHPEIVEATIKSARSLLGVKDREMLHKANGFLPVPKNSTTNVFGTQVNANVNATQNIAILPPMEDSVKRISDRFNDVLLQGIPDVPVTALLDDGDEEEDDE